MWPGLVSIIRTESRLLGTTWIYGRSGKARLKELELVRYDVTCIVGLPALRDWVADGMAARKRSSHERTVSTVAFASPPSFDLLRAFGITRQIDLNLCL